MLIKINIKKFFRVALLQPVPGGHVTITSQSSKIFQLLKSANPMMQLLYASLVNHSLRYYDGTKMAALLTTKYILNCIVYCSVLRQFNINR